MNNKHALPSISMKGLQVISVGCWDGKELTLPEFDGAYCVGVDNFVERIEEGKRKYPLLDLRLARAESLPFGDNFFDVYMSRVTLCYTNIPKALLEAHRVMKPGGLLYLTLHDWRMQWGFFKIDAKELCFTRTADHLLYVLPHSVYYALTGKCYHKPLRPAKFECFQTQWRIRRHLKSLGFRDIRIERNAKHFIVEAVKA